MNDIYISKAGTIERSQNSIRFKNEKEVKLIPIKNVNSIYCLNEVSLNTKLLGYLTKHQIPIYFYSYSGYYVGCFAPREETISGNLLVKQVQAYQAHNQRLDIAKEFVQGALHNIIKTLFQYDLNKAIKNLKKQKEKIDNCNTINNLLLIEANIRQYYYKQFNEIIKNKDFEFIKRTKRPPDNYINTLISFGNSLLYTTTLSEIFKTQLNPTISYLHEPFERRYSLNLDIADIFKPLIVDRVIFTLINKNIIKPKDFDKKLNYCYLNKDGRIKFIKEYDSKLNQTLKYPRLNRNVSYRYMLRLECYKLIKQLLDDEKYKSFKIYW